MGIDLQLLEAQCMRTLERTSLQALGLRIEGKVRDSYVDGDRRVLVATDRISAFDVIVGTLPFKGQVLNQLAAFWFRRTASVAPNHLIDVPDPVVSVARECRLVPVEFVVRGYLTGISPTSIWSAYARGERVYCGHRLPDGLRRHERLPQPLVTPTTKAPKGAHDELASRADLVGRGLVTEELFDRAARMALDLFDAGTRWAESRGLILADTKYEMGLDGRGELVVIDEIHTPDSSRYWYRETYQGALSKGRDPEPLDKEFVRRWLVDHGFRGQGAPPELPVDVCCEASRRYIEAYELVTGAPFEPSTEEPIERIRRNLSSFFGKKV